MGLAGAAGADGTVWFADALPPQTVPSNLTGKPNDFFLDGVTGDVYKKDISNTWVRFSGPNPVNLKNPNTRKIQITNAPAFTVVANSAQLVNFAFAGAAVGDVVAISPNFTLADGLIISYARVVSANNIEVKFFNVTGATITVLGTTYDIAIIKS